MKAKIKIRLLLILVFFTCSCGNSEVFYPKKRGFIRIDLPQKEYIIYKSDYPFSFKMPIYSKIQPKNSDENGTIWFNLEIPIFKGNINFSYRKVNNNLYELTEDTREFVNKHIAKANEILQTKIEIKVNNVYGIKYNIEGSATASPYQFYITDSTKNYLRGALYFDHIPNNDSIEPIILRVKDDMDTLIQSFRWN